MKPAARPRFMVPVRKPWAVVRGQSLASAIAFVHAPRLPMGKEKVKAWNGSPRTSHHADFTKYPYRASRNAYAAADMYNTPCVPMRREIAFAPRKIPTSQQLSTAEIGQHDHHGPQPKQHHGKKHKGGGAEPRADPRPIINLLQCVAID